eukprot:5184680-Pleurochrysis_carterae.AAC.1
MLDPSNQAQPYSPPAAFTGSPVPGRNDRALAFPSDSVIVHSLPFLPWDLSTPNAAILPDWALCAVVLPACSFASDPITQQQLSSIPVPYLTITVAAAAR